MARLDELLWEPRSIRLLDPDNHVIPRVFPATAAAALELLDTGAGAAAVLGTLRPGVRAVDLDLSSALADPAREAILDWARVRGHATLVRPSGRDGHAHVLLAGPALADDEPALEELCAALRHELGRLPYGAIDPRPSKALRTLTSPHRHGLPTGPITGDLRAFARVVEQLAGPPSTSTARSMTTTSTAEALIPRPRPHRPLPEHLAHWLATGQEWTITGGHDHTRTTREAIATAAMVRAGWTHEQAWTAIVTAHPGAMTRARSNVRRWTRNVWNRAVVDNADVAPVREPLPVDLARDLAAARGRLDEAARLRLSPRARRAVLLVGDAVLAMLTRRKTRRVSVAQRTLHEDLALSRPVIGRALAWLDDAGVIVLDRTVLDRRLSQRASTSYEAVLPEAAMDNSEKRGTTRGVRENSPPSSHTPASEVGLPRQTNQLLRTLALGEPLEVDVLAVRGLLTTGPTPTASERRSTETALRALAEVGHVRVDVEGRWHLSDGPSTEHEQVQARARAERTARITAERAAYRSAASSDWSIARAAAHKAVHARKIAWWDALTHDERIERSAHHAMRYAALSLAEQMQMRDRLARSRAAAGIDEHAHARQWAGSFSDAQWAERTAMRAAIHRSLPPPERVARVAAWEHHRALWRLPRIQHPSTAAPRAAGDAHELFDGAAERDAAYLEQLTLDDQLGQLQQIPS